jgi:hypothetical protein
MKAMIVKTLYSAALAGVLLLSAGLGGCSKVSKQNYDRIQVGMTRSEVEATLGRTDEKSSAGASVGLIGVSGQALVWRENDRTITIVFVNERVMLKSQTGL